MGASWVTVRDAITAGTLRATDKGVAEVAGRWDQLIRFAASRMGRQLGIEVQPALTRKELAEPAPARRPWSPPGRRREAHGGAAHPERRRPDQSPPTSALAGHRLVDVDAPRGPATDPGQLAGPSAEGRPETLRIDCYATHARGHQRPSC